MNRSLKNIGMPFLIISLLLVITACSSGSTQKEGSSTVQSQSSQKSETGKAAKSDKSSASNAISTDSDSIAPTILAAPTDTTITVNVLPVRKTEFYIEYGTSTQNFSNKTGTFIAEAATPHEAVIQNLLPNTHYYYHLKYRDYGADSYKTSAESSFVTQRAQGSTFTFAIQGDSHPERAQQFDAGLYITTMKNVLADKPDFYLTMGDDFSVDTMKSITQKAVEQLYINQRNFLSTIGVPLFLVNGNHEQAAEYVLNGSKDNATVWGQNARNSYFSQPVPNNFYTGDMQQVQFIGQLRDYYAWTWGDALFVVIDPYWHSSVPVDNVLGGGAKTTDMWNITLGDAQYQWLEKTLETSKSKYKFVFTHHVLGTGRGGTDIANEYEWGGYGKNGVWEFNQKRPGWDMPIQQLMAKTGVTIFFQGHDHIFAKDELDGVVYQTLPEPADPNYALFNADAYKSAIKYPNSGHVRVTVSPSQVKVVYVASLLPKDEVNGKANGQVIYSYSVLPK